MKQFSQLRKLGLYCLSSLLEEEEQLRLVLVLRRPILYYDISHIRHYIHTDIHLHHIKLRYRIATSSSLAAHDMRLALIDPLHFFPSINITHRLVRPDILYPGEAKRKSAVVPIAFLYAIKRNL